MGLEFVITRRIEVVRKSELWAANSTRGILREKAFESGKVIVSRSRVAGGVVSDWHHHAARHLYGFLFSGLFRLEYGPEGREIVELKPGDHFHIPPGLVHRDVNPNEKREAVVIAVLVGKGTPVVNVKGP